MLYCYPDLCARIFTEESLKVIDGGSGDAECFIFKWKGIPDSMRVKLGSNNTVENGSEVGFKSGNGIVAMESSLEAATTVFTLVKRGESKRREKELSLSMKLPQQVCDRVGISLACFQIGQSETKIFFVWGS